VSRPYYQDSLVTIYHGDCREVLPTLGRFDLLLTDPPYGIGASSAAFRGSEMNGWRDYGDESWDGTTPSPEAIGVLLASSRFHIIWGGNYFAKSLPESSGWLVWDKGQRDFSLADGELAWTGFPNALRIFGVSRAKALKDGKVHPTQKSVAVMEWSLAYADRNAAPAKISSVLDPYMGSGTTLVAAKNLGRSVVGIERSEKYCELAAERCRQETLFGEVA
jgi:DNA modification methylase